jgi:hypothetical protein
MADGAPVLMSKVACRDLMTPKREPGRYPNLNSPASQLLKAPIEADAQRFEKL